MLDHELIEELKLWNRVSRVSRGSCETPAAKFWESDFGSASEKAFPGYLAEFFVAELLQKRGCFKTQEFIRFLSTGVVSASSRTLTCPFQQSNPNVWSLLRWHPTRTHLWVRLSVFLKLFVSTVTVPPSGSDYVNRSASHQQFRLIHQRRAWRLRSDERGHKYQALDHFLLWRTLFFIKLFWNWTGVVRFVCHEVWSDKRFFIRHFLHLMFLTNSVIVITDFLNSNHFQYQWIGKVKKTPKSDGPWTRFLFKEKAPQARFWCEKTAPREKMRGRQDFFDWILMDTLSFWCSM